ncbi:hypothetical protein A1Q2_06623 [Trichosporon asahii var. asahii CBS 8904]|uniref:Uncharacterized protein n=1 Tax=Trichosporon asahii var. asahii (strain CBS 8904) TaxID=1220162 RepID=K1VQS0_TRIAC|nr:hypothetical protein A1Q2_06623 [Trichosporon asahii var. asahii CBS 8904]
MFGLRWLTCCFAQNTPLLAPPAPTKATTQPTATGKPLAALSALLGYGYKTETRKVDED